MARTRSAGEDGGRLGLLLFLAVLLAGPASAEAAGDAAGAALVPVATLAPPVGLPDAAREPPGRDRIRVGTFNIGWFTGVPGAGFVPRTPQDYLRIARVVRATHADVLCLQEVLDKKALEVLCDGLDQLSRGATDFRAETPEGESLYIDSGDKEERQSLGFIYDALRVTMHEPRELVELGRAKFTRLPVQVGVRAAGARLAFDLIGVHLKSGMLKDRDVERRAEEVRLLVEWLQIQRKGDKDYVLLGDFNSPRDHESMAALDAIADQGLLVAVEDHLSGEARGTHIPFDVPLDRMFMSPSLWRRARVDGSAWIHRFDDFMPRAHEIDSYCIYSRSRVWKKELRCDCEGNAPEPAEPESPPTTSAAAGLPVTGSEPGEGAPPPEAEAPSECAGDVRRWIKSANYLRVSDHRPLLWDLGVRRKRRARTPPAVEPAPVATAALPVETATTSVP